jgi:predicted transcriptional regulator
MKARRSLSPQEVPEEFAALLRRLHHDDDPLLNTVLAASREHDWRTPTLASVLEMNPPAVSKRIERARRAVRAEWGTVSNAETAEAIRKIVDQYPEIQIPDAPRVQAMIDGKQLAPGKIDELLAMQRVSEKVNGAMPAEHPSRRVSEHLSDELNRLITEEGFTPYYLAQVLGRSHRAITSRLERHHFRDPCPSVAGTASGEYHSRKIGDPGEGVRRIPPELRDLLRAGWDAVEQGGDPAGLHRTMRLLLDSGFTKASVAQALHVGNAALERQVQQTEFAVS